MRMKRFYSEALLVIAVALPLVVGAQQLPLARSEVRGNVEQWAPASKQIKVDGQAYAVARDVQVLNSKAELLPVHAVRAGASVELRLMGGEVTHVVVNPGANKTMD